MNISVSEVKELLKSKKINLIDIRSSYKYGLGTIPGSININENELLFNVDKYLNKNEKYYIFCESGTSSKMICNLLNKMGYSVYNIIGGYSKYVLDKN